MSANQTMSRNFKLFGFEDQDAFIASVQESLTFKFSGIGMIIMSLMSDAQEEMEMGYKEDARKTLNRAKLLVTKFVNKD